MIITDPEGREYLWDGHSLWFVDQDGTRTEQVCGGLDRAGNTLSAGSADEAREEIRVAWRHDAVETLSWSNHGDADPRERARLRRLADSTLARLAAAKRKETGE